MNWFYAEGGKQQGPIDEAQLVALIQSGKITQETLVWHEGMANWLPLRLARASMPPAPVPPPVAPEAAVPAATPSTTGDATGIPASEPSTSFGSTAEERLTCSECGQTFAKGQTVQYGTVTVCATCKPGFLDRVMGKAASVNGSQATVTEQELLAREYKIDIGGCLERAWALFTENPGTMIATSLMVTGTILLVSIVGNLIPGAGFIVSILLSGPMMAGYLWFLLRLGRKEAVTAGDAFAGFSKGIVQTALVALIQTVASFLCMAPVLTVAAAAGIFTALHRGATPEIAIPTILGLISAGLAAIVAVTYLTTLWTHALLLVIDKGYAFWPAMELSRKLVQKRWWMTFLFVFVAGIISSLGACACGIGLIVTVPLQFAMKAFLYEDNFSDLEPAPRKD